MEKIPQELFTGCESGEDRAARLGRYVILQELSFFGEPTNLKLARGEYKGQFIGAVRKHFSSIYDGVGGCEPADIEIAAEYLGVFDEVFNVEASESSKHLKDR